MNMYLVMCFDPRPKYGWFAWSGAKKTRQEAEEALARADKEDWNGKPIKYKILEFWMPSEYISA